jgi:hypothetical protein
MSKIMKLVRAGRGRPQKFGRPSRAVTLTLPEDVIGALTSVDDDLSRAVVRLMQPIVADVVPRPPAELTKYGDSAVIVIKPVDALRRIPGVSLVPLPDGRALISLEGDMAPPDFELKVRDVLDENGHMDGRERAVLMSIIEILKSARRTRGIHVRQRGIIVLQAVARTPRKSQSGLGLSAFCVFRVITGDAFQEALAVSLASAAMV